MKNQECHHICNCNNGLTRRKFIKVTGSATLGTAAISGIAWSDLISQATIKKSYIYRNPLHVKPVFIYSTPIKKDQTSWRAWGGIQSEQDADKELVHINEELKELRSKADFPVEFLSVTRANKIDDLNTINDINSVDVILTYSAGRQIEIHDILGKMGKNMIIFARHKSGPVYQTYESMSNNLLRRRTDQLFIDYADDEDIVIDSQEEILWRLRALCGLKNTIGSTIIAVGGPSGWGSGYTDEIKHMVEHNYKLNIKTFSYEDLGNLIKEARADKSFITKAKSRAEEYLRDPNVKLETQRQFVDNAFMLEDLFRLIMNKYNCKAITINSCMSTIIPLAETTACMTLSMLNDEGFLAFCESDFVVIPVGILLANITGNPVFLNDPTYSHNNTNTLAHCTAPRRMDGKNLEPARIVTHFESDYGAAPKVEMKLGHTITNIIADFGANHCSGIIGKIESNPFYDICRSQIDVSYERNSKIMQKEMTGFHWITAYGDYMKEINYALKKIGIGFKEI